MTLTEINQLTPIEIVNLISDPKEHKARLDEILRATNALAEASKANDKANAEIERKTELFREMKEKAEAQISDIQLKIDEHNKTLADIAKARADAENAEANARKAMDEVRELASRLDQTEG